MKKLPTSLRQIRQAHCKQAQCKRQGFTLIELLVAISIVAILSTIGMVVYGGVQAKSRDAKRSGDLTAITDALEGNKQAGSIFYTALAGANFAGGSIPSDPRAPLTQKYCLWGETDVPPVPGIAKPTSANVNWTTCAITGSSPEYTAVIGDGVPVTATKITAFTICAKLEAVTGGVECRSSKL